MPRGGSQKGRVVASRRLTVAERFWPKVDKNGPIHPVLGTACWDWTGQTDGKFGYGRIAVGMLRGQFAARPERMPRIGTHRVGWELANGPIPSGMCVCHKCDRPSCVRADHLFLGTMADNDADKATKGRDRAPWKPSTRAKWASRSHCANGHALTEETIYRAPNGKTQCKLCRQAAGERLRRKRGQPVRRLARNEAAE